MAIWEKISFSLGQAGARALMSSIFTPKTVEMRVTYKIDNDGTTQFSGVTSVTFEETTSGVEISNVILEDVIPANAYIRSFEFRYPGGNIFFRVSLAENGTTDMIIFTEQGLLFIEELEIIAGGNWLWQLKDIYLHQVWLM